MAWTKIGVDLGTATLLIAAAGKGILIQEPSVVAVQKRTGKVLAVGQEAQDMLGRTPEHIEMIRPLREGVISDFEATEALLKTFLRRIPLGWLARFRKPPVVVCVPSVISPVERRAVESACQEVGMGSVQLIEEPVAAALGAGLEIHKAKGSLVVDIGGGTTDICVISLGAPVAHATLRIAGDVLNEAILLYLRKERGLLIGEKTAEELKCGLGSACPPSEDQVQEGMTIRGRNLQTGMPAELFVSRSMIYEALQEPLMHIVEGIRSVLEQTPPDLLSDVVEEGMTLTGGGALLGELARFLTEQTGLKSKVADDPVTCVVRGTERAFAMLDRLAEWNA